jgi:hypothetical protein
VLITSTDNMVSESLDGTAFQLLTMFFCRATSRSKFGMLRTLETQHVCNEASKALPQEILGMRKNR